MSQWHRAHPELTGTDADPWMQHESYRKAVRIEGGPTDDFASYCPHCFTGDPGEDYCESCGEAL